MSFWSILLFPLSLIFLLISLIIKNFQIQKKLSIPIICVGNIYVGGTGKTPLVKEIFKITKSLGKNPAFIKKSYNYLLDEIKMLQKTGKTFVSKDRIKAINSSIFNNHDLAILDDGYQDFTMKKTFSILCFNSKQLIGNGLIIPSGPLREPLNAIQRSDCIMINGDKNLEFENKINKNMGNKKIPIFYSRYKIKNIEKLQNIQIVAFAGIGNPANFFDLLIKNNLKLKKTYSFPDHHSYSQMDFDKIIGDSSTKVVTTEKDYFRMNENQKQRCEYVDVNLEIENKDDLEKLIKNYI
jgi:tetraacyldisaccharide 4'-kinase